MSDQKDLDPLGIKGLSDSVRIATQGFLDGAAAFLSRVCLPAAEELGLALRERISAWRARNTARMLSGANGIYLSNNPNPTDQLSPRLAYVAIEEASWIDVEEIQNMWSGLLASSTSPQGHSDENLLFMNLLKQLSSLEVKMLQFAVEKAPKRVVTPHGLVVSQAVIVSVNELPELFGIQDIQRLDRELDHLRELGLIEGGIVLDRSNTAHLTPTSLAMHLYVRSQGSRLPPMDYWNLTLPTSNRSDL